MFLVATKGESSVQLSI